MKKYIILILISLLFISCNGKIENLENSKYKKDDVIKIESHYYLVESFDADKNRYVLLVLQSKEMYSDRLYFVSARYVHNNAIKFIDSKEIINNERK